MAAKRAAVRSRTHCGVVKTEAAPASTAHRLHLLLLAVQEIAGFEDELCSLLHEATRSEAVEEELAAEVREVLARMPAHAYVHDLETLQAALDTPTPPKATKSPTRRPAAAKIKTKTKAKRGKAVATPAKKTPARTKPATKPRSR